MKTDLMSEPDLVFGQGNTCVDPKVGLLSFGPSGTGEEGRFANAGAIGTSIDIARLRSFLEKIRRRISPGASSEEKPWKCDFPGLGKESPINFDIRIKSYNHWTDC